MMSYMRICWFVIVSWIATGYSEDACPKTREVPRRCDFIIVGAGAAGATIAVRLSEDPSVSVCLFEAGIKHTDGPFAAALPIPRVWTALSPLDHIWNTSTLPQTGLNGRTLFNGMGKTTGGSTSRNGMAYFRGFKADFDYWAENGATGWDYESVFPFFLKSENMTIPELVNSPLHSTCGPLTISQNELDVISPLWNVWERAANELSIPIVDCNGPSPFGLCLVQNTIKQGKRHSTANAFLEPASGRRNLFVVTEALVGRILIRGNPKRAYGIRYNKHGRIFTVRATKEVIVSGGVFESPKLLQISGIGPNRLLQKLKVRKQAVLPVGKRMQDHLLFILDLDINVPTVVIEDLISPKAVGEFLFQGRGLWAENRLAFNGFIDVVKQKHNWADVEFIPLDGRAEEGVSNSNIKEGTLPAPLPGRKDKNGTSFVFYVSHPKSRGTVKAQSKDPMDNPLIDPKYLTERVDVITLIKGIRYVQKVVADSPSLRKAGAELVVRNLEATGCVKGKKKGSNAFWECVFRKQAANGFHTAGTCPIGVQNSKFAVVDPELRVYGIRSLRVADASVMPEVTSGPPMAPAIMIGERAAHFIKQTYKLKSH